MIRILLSLIFIYCITLSAQSVKYEDLRAEDKEFLDSLQHRTFLYFVNEISPDFGLVKDRSAEWSPASTAATGFGVAAWVTGVERGWMKREDAAKYVLNLLNFLLQSDQSGTAVSTGYKGFYYHFLDLKKGKREWKSELSTIDTALLLAGIRLAVQYFDKDNETEKEIRKKGDKVTNKIDWNWMTLKKDNAQAERFIGSVTMGWTPEEGFHGMGWIGYNEALILYILAAGSGYKDAGSAYNVWLNHYQWQEPYKGLGHVVFPPLFGHQYTQMFVSLKGWQDSYMKEKGIDYFENSRRAALTQRLYSIDNPYGWKGYDSLVWGITACDGPGDIYNKDGKTFLGYAGRGTSGPQFNYFDDGTIAPTAAGGSVPFTPEESIAALKAMKERYGKDSLWSKYGFTDSFNPTAGWTAKDYLGIDQGPILIMIENYRSGLIWKYMMKDPVVKKGLEVLGFSKKED